MKLDRFRPLTLEEKRLIRQEIIDNCEPATDGGCRLYRGTRSPDGYAMKYIQGKMRPVGRFMLCYKTRESMNIDADACHGTASGCSCTHLDADCCCQGESNCPRWCVNPDHLYWGTHGENCKEKESISFRFGYNARKAKSRSLATSTPAKTRSLATTKPVEYEAPDLSAMFS